MLDGDGQPTHDRGVARAEPRLAFVGLPFQYAVTSDVLPGVGRDAKRIARHLAGLAATGPAPGEARRTPRTTAAHA